MNVSADAGRAADRQAIHDLLVDYCSALDRMDLEALAALFSDDCDVEYGPDEALRASGRGALAKSLERMWRWRRTSHHLSNLRIEFDDADTARATSYVLAWHERPDGSTATVFGQYRDRLRRSVEGWQITSRRMLMNGCDAGFTVNLHRLDRRPPPAGWVAPDIDGPAAGRGASPD